MCLAGEFDGLDFRWIAKLLLHVVYYGCYQYFEATIDNIVMTLSVACGDILMLKYFDPAHFDLF